jgi:hypothetical protein
LTLTFLAIMNGKVMFPGGGFMDNFIGDLLSPYEKIQGSPGMGERRVFDRTADQPDDFCNALCYACLVVMHALDESIVNLVPDNAYAVVGMDLKPDRYLQAPNAGYDDDSSY